MFQRLLLSMLLLVPLALAQQSAPATGSSAKKSLTNADVVAMVKAGLEESTVTLAIEQNPTQFDTSTTALISLKNDGVPKGVIEAMLRSNEPASSSPVPPNSAPAASSPSNNDTVHMLSEGTYYKGDKGWVKLEQLTMAGAGMTKVGKMFVPGLTPQMVWTYRGAQSPIQLAERRPLFYVKESPYMANIAGRSSRDIVIVRFDKKKDHRELQATSGGNAFTFKSGFSKEKIPEITVDRVSETIFTITPKADLPPGEYLITYGAGGSGYDFGIKEK
jgi:hypothetical protein